MDDCSIYRAKGEGTRSYGKGQKEKVNLLMIKCCVLRNYWLDQIAKRKEQEVKDKLLEKIVDRIGKLTIGVKGKYGNKNTIKQ